MLFNKASTLFWRIIQLGWISQSTKIHLQMSCQYHHRDLYHCITLCYAITIKTQLRSIIVLCDELSHLVPVTIIIIIFETKQNVLKSSKRIRFWYCLKMFSFKLSLLMVGSNSESCSLLHLLAAPPSCTLLRLWN